MNKNPFKIQEGTVRDADLGNYTHKQNEGDSIVYSNNRGWLGKSLRNETIFFFYFFLLLMFMALFTRAFLLEVVHGDSYAEQSAGNRTRYIVHKAPRGILYDSFGKQLVYNTSHFYVYIDQQALQDDEHEGQVVSIIERVLDEPIDFVSTGYADPVLVAEKIDYEKALRLIAAARLEPAIVVRLEPTREYVNGYGLGHVLGYIGSITREELKMPQYSEYGISDTLGKRGVEKTYESQLRGIDGYEEIETDAVGRSTNKIAEVAPIKGQDITVTLDLNIQEKLYNALQTVAQQHNKPRSGGVVMNPKTGAILALVSLPDFDNNLFTSRLDNEELVDVVTNEDQPLFTRTVSGEYPPGSTFKIIMAAAGLQEGIVDDKFTVMSVGGLDINGFFFPDWRPGGHGLTNIYHALADSVNTYFYILGGGDNEGRLGLGIDRMMEYARKFGLDAVTGIDIPGEGDGFLPSPEWKEEVKGERWFLGDTYNASIGQGDITVTPLQMGNVINLVASGGYETTPHLVEHAGLEPVRADWLSLDNLGIIKQSLRRTITDGSAQSLQRVNVPVAGKTGTAQFRRDKSPHSWFTGFAPYDDPEFTVTVLIEEGGDEGLAVKAARLFLESYYNN